MVRNGTNIDEARLPGVEPHRKEVAVMLIQPEQRCLSVTSEAQTKKSIADIGISAPSAKLI